jgi:hypothetical protein
MDKRDERDKRPRILDMAGLEGSTRSDDESRAVVGTEMPGILSHNLRAGPANKFNWVKCHIKKPWCHGQWPSTLMDFTATTCVVADWGASSIQARSNNASSGAGGPCDQANGAHTNPTFFFVSVTSSTRSSLCSGKPAKLHVAHY